MDRKTLLVPPSLKPKDYVAIFSPAGAVKKEDLDQGLNELKKLGFNYQLMASVWARCRYLAGRDEERILDLLQAFKKFPALWASRGGYGCLRLLPWLEALLPEKIRKTFWLIGFSDLTILLNYFYQRFGLLTLHGPMIHSLPYTSPEALKTLKRLLLGQQRLLLYKGVFWREGEAEGPLLGGNLSSLVSLLGTPWFPDLNGALLFLEEVNESPYRVDRLLSQLAFSGKLDQVKALILGEFSGLSPETLREIVIELFPGPILACLPIGHTPKNYPLLIGALSRIYSYQKEGFLEQIRP